MDWRLHGGGARCHSPGLATHSRAKSGSAPCALSSVTRAAHVNADIRQYSCLAPLRCTEAGSCRGRVRRTATAAASGGSGGLGAPEAAAVAYSPLHGSAFDPSSRPRSAPSEGSLAAVLDACDGPRTSEQQQVLELEAQLAGGMLKRMTWRDKPFYVANCFGIVAQASMDAGLLVALCAWVLVWDGSGKPVAGGQ